MHKYRWVLFVLTAILLMGCPPVLIQDTPTAPIKTKQDKAEHLVQEHVSKNFSKLGTYKSYRFGELFALKPQEIVELEDLKKLKKQLPEMQTHFGDQLDSVIAANDTAIAQKERYIKANDIHTTYEISHLFKITTPTDKRTIYEYKFYIHPTGKIKDVEQVMQVDLTAKQDDWFHYFIMQYPLFSMMDKEAEQKLNAKVYHHFNSSLATATDDKGDLLKAILGIVQHIKERGNMDPDLLGKASIKKWMDKNKSEIRGYKPIAYSKAKPIHVLNEAAYKLQLEVNRYKTLMKDATNSDEQVKTYIQKIEKLEHEIKAEPDSLAGFKMFHAFQQKEGVNETMEKALYFEMDLFFRIKNVLHVQPPIEPYFEE